jgi:probable blue pigment (indigoidine) exporter
VLLTRRLPAGGWWWRAALLGTLNIGAFFALLFVAAHRLPGGVAATVISVQPLFVLGLSAALLATRPSRWAFAAGLSGVLGVALVALRGDARLDGLGLAAAVGAALVMATGVVLARRWSPPVGPWTFAGWQLTAGGIVLLPLTVLVEGPVPPALDLTAAAGLVYLSLVGAALAYPLWFRGIRLLSPTSVTFLGLLSPVVAATIGWAVLGQNLTVLQTLGAGLVLTSIVTGQPSRRPEPTDHPTGVRDAPDPDPDRRTR